jgi:hypothetical protein
MDRTTAPNNSFEPPPLRGALNEALGGRQPTASAFVDVESVFGGGSDDDGTAIAPTRVPFFLVFTKVEGDWGVAVERVGARLR